MKMKQYCLNCKEMTILIDKVVVDKYLKGRCNACGKSIIVLVHDSKGSIHAYNFCRKV